MNDNNLIHLLKGLRYLDNLNLEEKLSVTNSQLKLLNQEYFVDLSQCGYAELGAQAKTLLIIESFLKKKSIVYLALPTTKYTYKEQEHINRKADSGDEAKFSAFLSSRINANSFLKITGFVQAIQEITKLHKGECYITESYDFESKFNSLAFEESFSVVYPEEELTSYNYRYLLPFKWIDCSKNVSEFKQVEKDLQQLLQNPERGMDSVDVKTIKNVIISELRKNVDEHSGTKYGLLTIGLINSSSLLKDSLFRKKNPIEDDYLTWISNSGFSSQVEIYFGDSGSGILTKKYRDTFGNDSTGKKLTPAKQLELAFQKWTTLKNDKRRRGTKGLYRIQRIINKYNGIIHIDTGKLNGGFRKGGLKEPIWHNRTSVFDFKGTLVNIKLNPYKQITAFNYTLGESLEAKEWNSFSVVVDKDLKCVPKIIDRIKSSDNLLLILDISLINDQLTKIAYEKLLLEISHAAHPCVIVLYLISNLSNDTIDTLTDSVNSYIREEHKNQEFPEVAHEDAEEIYDPVLVIVDNNQAFWYGGSKELVAILNESFGSSSKHSKSLNSIQNHFRLNPKTKTQIKLHLENDNKLVNLTANDELIFNFRSIDRHYREKIDKLVNLESDKDFCSPKLHVTKNWIDVGQVLKEDEHGFALSLYLKYREIFDVHKIDKAKTFLLIDHNQQKNLAIALAQLLGLHKSHIRNIESDIDHDIPRRTKLFPPNTKVIVLTTLISSSETARRLVKYVKRDFARPEIILCMGNLRKYDITTLETWNDTTSILGCYQQNDTEQQKETKEAEYHDLKLKVLAKAAVKIGPDYKEESKPSLVSLDQGLKLFLNQNKLLHYNHVGNYNKRHFTFFLDKKKLLGLPGTIWDKFLETLNNWLTQEEIDQYQIYISNSIYHENGEFIKFIKASTGITPKKGNVDQKVYDKNVFFFDFGMITGDSVNKFILSCDKVHNLFICILFNQSINAKINFYKRIESLNNSNSLSGKPISTNFKIEYIFHLPLNFFTSSYLFFNNIISEFTRLYINYI